MIDRDLMIDRDRDNIFNRDRGNTRPVGLYDPQGAVIESLTRILQEDWNEHAHINALDARDHGKFLCFCDWRLRDILQRR